jgi:hypothetical protein
MNGPAAPSKALVSVFPGTTAANAGKRSVTNQTDTRNSRKRN